ncbi:MAG TPA: transcription termination/antitermination NusG family protein [Pyrinomonadaceae bacterium]|jgi:transcriptional antiterminator RfaH|nr:transcription termination/antitermination NusG family protein [Pyrinomonadaceae bacterium]
MSAEIICDVPRWYVVQTGLKQEERAAHNLNAWGMETFSPKLRLRRRNPFTGTLLNGVGPMFPRYIFARFDASVLLHKVNYTRGVHYVVSFGGNPAPVDDSIIGLIKAQMGDDGLVHLGGEFKHGDEVKIKDGPLRNFVGVFDHRINNTDRVEILLTTVNFQARIVIEVECVEKIDERVAA